MSATDVNPLIVYVDDEPANRTVFEASMKSRFRVESFASGEEALARLETGDVAVLVTDQRMPGLSGNEILQRARARSPNTQRVVITAYDDAGPILEALNTGLASRYVVKPWVRTELIETLESCLDVYRLRLEKISLEHRLFEGERFVTLGGLSAGIYHDMSQPLLVLSSALDTFEATDPTVMADAKVAAGQLLAMIRSAKQFLVPGGRVEPRGDAREASGAAATLCHGRLRNAGVALEIDIAETLPPTQMATTAIVQVLVNLLVNASQAIRGEGPKSIVKLRVRPGDGGVEMSVRDNGTGMPPEILAKALKPFFTTKPSGEGTGLGLFSCQRLATENGGRLSIESKAGEGTTVTLWVPAAPGD